MRTHVPRWAPTLLLLSTLHAAPQSADLLEPNDTAASAVEIRTPVFLSGLNLHAPVAGQGDVDRFAIGLNAGDLLVARVLDPGDSALDPLLLLEDGGGALVASSDGLNGSSFGALAFTATSAASYQLIVTGSGDAQGTGLHAQAGEYCIEVRLAAPDALEPNADPTQASTLGGLPVAVDACLDDGDVDWFRFEAPAAGEYWVRVEGDPDLPGDPRVGVFDAAGTTLLAESADHFGRFPALAFQAAGAGTYFLAVTGQDDTTYAGAHMQAGSYRLRLFERPGDAYESNDDLASAAVLTTMPFEAMLEFDAGSSGDVDFFSHAFALGDQIRMRTRDPGEQRVGTRVAIYDPATTARLAMASSITPQEPYSELVLRSPVAGRLALGVTGRSDDNFVGFHNEVGPYDLKIAWDLLEPNDEVFRAAVLSGLGRTEDLVMLDGDVDWFRIDLQEGEQRRIAGLAADGLSADLRLGLFDATQQLVAVAEGQGGGILPAIHVRAEQASTWYLAVTGAGDTAFQGLHTTKGGYGLEVRALQPIVLQSAQPAIGFEGSTVRLVGAGFTTERDMEVRFGGVPATILNIASGNELFVEAPAQAQGGPVDILVRTINGSTIRTAGFSYVVARPLVLGQTFAGNVDASPDWISFEVLGSTLLDLDLRGERPVRLTDGELHLYDPAFNEVDVSAYLRPSSGRVQLRRFPIPAGADGVWYVEIRSQGGAGADYSLRTRRKVGRELSKPDPAAGAGVGSTLEIPLSVEPGSTLSATLDFAPGVQLLGARLLDATRVPIPGTSSAITVDAQRGRVSIKKALLPAFGDVVLVVEGTGNAGELVRSKFKVKFPRSPRDLIEE